MTPTTNSRTVHRSALDGGAELRRRHLLRAACAIGGVGIAGCGGGLFGPEEGEDVFTFDVKLLNAAVFEDTVTVSSGGRTYSDQLPYGQIGSVRLQEDDFGFAADVTVKGNTTRTETTLRAVQISPVFFVLLSTAVASYSLLEIGGVPGPYGSNGETPYPQLRQITAALGPVDVFALEGTGTQLPMIGTLQAGSALPIPQGALASYKLVFAQNGSAIYESGPREKPADSLLLVMRTAPLANPSSTWGVYLIDSSYAITKWENTRA
jgi:hypothetical protein